MKYQAECQGSIISIEEKGGSFHLGDSVISPDIHGKERASVQVGIDHRLYMVQLLSCSEDGKTMQARINGKTVQLTLKSETDLMLEKMGMGSSAGAGSGKVKAPMPGLIVKVLVQPGDKVEKGDVLLNFEAMKMENQLKSPVSGTIRELKTNPGAKVDKGQVLVEIG